MVKRIACLALIPGAVCSSATVSSVAANGQTVLSNKTHITANPIITFVGIGHRF